MIAPTYTSPLMCSRFFISYYVANVGVTGGHPPYYRCYVLPQDIRPPGAQFNNCIDCLSFAYNLNVNAVSMTMGCDALDHITCMLDFTIVNLSDDVTVP